MEIISTKVIFLVIHQKYLIQTLKLLYLLITKVLEKKKDGLPIRILEGLLNT